MVSRSRSDHAIARLCAAGALAAAILAMLWLLAPTAAVAIGGEGTHGSQMRWRHGRAGQAYLALGDSLAFGYSQARFEANLPEENPEAFKTGYVDDFGAVLRLARPHLQIVNDGCPGETTESMIKGPCAYQLKYPLHHPYAGGPGSSQLSDALSYLAAHPGRVNPITIDIGANDALGVVEGACSLNAACIAEHAPALFEEIGRKLGLILGQLRATAPHARIVVLGLYNPFGASIEGADQLTAALNKVMAAAAAAVKASFADPLPLFNPPEPLEQPTLCLLTNMCLSKPDIHPTDLGYRVLAGVVLQQYLIGLPRSELGGLGGRGRVRRMEHVPVR